jgi:peptide/nickel transport system ATP-binding protein
VPSANKRGQRLVQIPGMTPSLLDLPTGCAFMARCNRATGKCAENPDARDMGAGRHVRCWHAEVAEAA